MPGQVTESSVIRDILTRYPKAEAIFNKHGLTGCGGPKGPIEPVGFFAVVHHVKPEELIAELNEFIGNYPQEEDAAPSAAEAAQPEFYKLFLKTALIIALSAGWTLGAIALASVAFGWPLGTAWAGVIKAHGHAQIFGWVGLFTMGIAYHVLPRLKATQLYSRTLALASFWLVLVGLVLRVVGQLVVDGAALTSLITISAAIELAGVSIFVYVALRTLASSTQPMDYYEKYLVAGIGWFWLFVAANLALGIYAFSLPGANSAAIPLALNSAYLQMGLTGFISMVVFGITLRTIPVFMGLRPPNKKAFTPIFWLLNLGIALSAGAGFAGSEFTPVANAGVVIVFVATAAFVYFLNLFRAPETNVTEAGDRSYEKFVYAAYAWLSVAITMSLAFAVYETATDRAVPGSFTGAYLHALAVGFISMMIMGMASRIIPVFAGTRLHSGQLSLGAFILINAGNVLRVVTEPAAGIWGGVFYPLLGISGWLEVLALTFFAYNIWKTMDKSPDDEPVGEAEGITGNMIVADVLKRYPASLGVLVSHGFTPLLNPVSRSTLARAVTIEQAARLHGKDAAKLLADLNAVAGAKEEKEEATAITKDSYVGRVAERYPSALDVFVRHGFEQLKDENLRRSVANSVTIELAARMHSIDLEKLLAELNEICGSGKGQREAEAVTGSSIVADVLDRYPASYGVFFSYGLTLLLKPEVRDTLARTVTVEQAARVNGKDVTKLLIDLNVAARAKKVEDSAFPRITKDSRVGKVIEEYPAALDVFLRYGFEQLKDETLRKTVAASVTIELAAHMHSIDLEKLLAELNEACFPKTSLSKVREN